MFILIIFLLFFLFTDYAKLKPELFAKFIPNIFPQTLMSDLDRYIEETKQLQKEINELPEFNR